MEKNVIWHRHVCSPSMYCYVRDKLMFNKLCIVFSVHYGEVKKTHVRATNALFYN